MNKAYERAVEILSNIVPLSNEDAQALVPIFEYQVLNKNDFLCKEGELPQYGGILLEGVMRAFYLREDGIDCNKSFLVEGDLPSPLSALIKKTPCEISFQALTKCEVVKYNYAQFIELGKTHPNLDTLYKRVLEKLWIDKEQREIQLIAFSAEKKYQYFKKRFPDLEHRIPLYHIASYIGITPVQLSRIRALYSQPKS